MSGWLRPRTLATAAAGLVLLVTAVFVSRTPNGSQVKNTAQIQTAPESSRALQTPKPAQPSTTVLAPSPSETASITLMQAERDVPNMQLAGNSQVDASLRDNLRTLNAFIADCEQHLKQNPQDELAREYLYTAYQQKAQLLTAMMESGRSEH
jgi:ribosomal protein S15P/S13E